MKKVDLYTDGACSSNPGVGGWAAIIVYNGHEKVLCQGDKMTTNNKMELSAVINGLSALKEKCEVSVYSDSKYVCDAINKGWLSNWQKNNWKKADKKPVLNTNLWQQLIELLNYHDVSFNWLKGHAGHEYNERCDALAVGEILKIKESEK